MYSNLLSIYFEVNKMLLSISYMVSICSFFSPKSRQPGIRLLSSEIEIESYDMNSPSFLTDPPLAL